MAQTPAQIARNARDRKNAADKGAYVAERKLSIGCQDHIYCGTIPLTASMLDLDHMPGYAKVANIADMVHATRYTIAHIEAEIAKCECVCKLCHQARTDARRLS